MLTRPPDVFRAKRARSIRRRVHPRCGTIAAVNRALASLALSVALLGCGEAPCPSGQTRCNSLCRDTLTDPAACGACGRLCPAGAACVNGVCQCPAGKLPCGTSCVDVLTDPQNCGACRDRCEVAGANPSLGACVGGACVCQNGASPCPALDPECRDLQNDPGNCGACGNACTRTGSACQGGGCVCPGTRPTACDPPEVAAPLCANLTSDAANCGACGNACTRSGAVCKDSTCACPASKPDLCDPPQVPAALCANLSTDPAHCGSCGARCATGATCSSRVCKCPTGQVECAGACVNPQTDPTNCGGCGNVCAAGLSCTLGVCCASTGSVCGATGAKVCCAGSACCGSGACQTVHSNGLGQSTYDCNPLGTYTEAAATAAANAWSATGNTYVGGELQCETASCVGRQTTSNCAVWCWDNPVRGRVRASGSVQCLCPKSLDSTSVSPTWN